jgi:hypothetical protein
VDLQQIGFCRPALPADPHNHRLKAANLAAVWQTFHASGARHLVVVGHVDRPEDIRRYREALPATTLTSYLLHAGRDQLTARILLRGQGMGPRIAGDELDGLPEAALRKIAADAAEQAEALARAGIGDVVIGTDGRDPAETASAILDADRERP